mmetsp:Transcript_136117/g.330854  ORF Transcript_136117/g.330854 Transcript_136117/m.330854 type:complete len:530 (-) Transcript_136117:21-1610(-)
MLQDVAVDHHLAGEDVCLLPHGDLAASARLADHEGVVPVAHLEVAAVVGVRRHGRDLEGDHVQVQRMRVHPRDGELVHRAHLERGKGWPVCHRAAIRVHVVVGHARALAAPLDHAPGTLEVQLPRLAVGDGGAGEVRQVAGPGRAEGGQLRGGRGPLGDAEGQQRGGRGAHVRVAVAVARRAPAALEAPAARAQRGRAGVGGAGAGECHVAAGAWEEHRSGDGARDRVQVDAVLREELHLARGISRGREGEGLLHGRVDHAEPVPGAGLDAHGLLDLTVHEEDIRVEVRSVGGGHGARQERGLRGHGHGLEGLEVVAGDEEDLLNHAGVLRGQVVCGVLDDQDAGRTAARLQGRGVVVVRVVPVGAAHVVVGNGKPVVGARARLDLREDVVRVVAEAVVHALGGDVQPVRVEVRGGHIAELAVRRGARDAVGGGEAVLEADLQGPARAHAEGGPGQAAVVPARVEPIVPERHRRDGQIMYARGGLEYRGEGELSGTAREECCKPNEAHGRGRLCKASRGARADRKRRDP